MRDSDTEHDRGDAGHAPLCTAWWLIDTSGLRLPDNQLPDLDWTIPHDGLVYGLLHEHDPEPVLETAYHWADLLDLEITDYDGESVTWAGPRGLVVIQKHIPLNDCSDQSR